MSSRMVYDDLSILLGCQKRVHGWLREQGMLESYGGVCESCGVDSMLVRKDRSVKSDGVIWRCSNSKCNKKISIRKGS